MDYGASHSGEGGGYMDSSTQTYVRGTVYDYYKEPTEPGSGADNSKGGGAFKVVASGSATIEGEINVRLGNGYVQISKILPPFICSSCCANGFYFY